MRHVFFASSWFPQLWFELAAKLQNTLVSLKDDLDRFNRVNSLEVLSYWKFKKLSDLANQLRMIAVMAMVIMVVSVMNVIYLVVQGCLSIVDIDDWHYHNTLLSHLLLELGHIPRLSNHHFVPNLLIVVILYVDLHFVGDCLELRVVDEILPPYLPDYVSWQILLCDVWIQSLLLECAVECADHVSFFQTQAILYLFVQFETNVYRSFHDEVHLVSRLKRVVNCGTWLFGPGLQNADDTYHEVSVDLVYPWVVDRSG